MAAPQDSARGAWTESGGTGLGLNWSWLMDKVHTRNVGAAARTPSGVQGLGSSLGQANSKPRPSRGAAPGEHPLIPALEGIVGPGHVLTSSTSTNTYTTGARLGKGRALAVCRPGTLVEAVAALRACVAAGVAVVPQGRNTGLTGGSVPRDSLCDRETVLISTERLSTIQAIGDQMLCLAGAGVYDLSLRTRSDIGRDSHSVLGSQFLNPTVAAGVAFGSGGTQLCKGPAFTQRALWAEVAVDGHVVLHNTLGVRAEDEKELLELVGSGRVQPGDMDPAMASVPASDAERYREHICRFDSSVARYNADTRGIAPCRSEGKVLILATLHDTFALPKRQQMLWVGCPDLKTAQKLKRNVLLTDPKNLPASCEYMDRDSFDVVDSAGRALCLAMSGLGFGAPLRAFWNLKLRIESLPGCSTLPDSILYCINWALPRALPETLHTVGTECDHNLLITVADYDGPQGDGRIEAMKDRIDAFSASADSGVRVHACNDTDAAAVTRFRFAAAPAFRTWCVGRGAQGVSIDYALPKNYSGAPGFLGVEPEVRMRYSHFGCNVVHEDVAFAPGVDAHAAKMTMKAEVEALGGRLPAEHGHGTEYKAPAETRRRWMAMDPLNVMNPGVGGCSYDKRYGVEESECAGCTNK